MEVRSVEAIVRALNAAEVKYLIVGGLAVNAYGYDTSPAMSILLLASRQTTSSGRLVRYKMSIPITAEQFADPANRELWRKEKNMTVLRLWSDVHRRTPVAVFVYEPFDFAREYASATWEEVIRGMKAPIVQYKTLIEMKKTAGRPQDLVDIADLEELRKLKENRD